MRLKAVLTSALFILFFAACNNNGTVEKEPVANTSTGNQQLNELEEKVSREPETDSLREGLVQQLVLNNQYDKALEQVEILLKNNPNSPAYLFMKADAFEKKGDTANAIFFYRQSIAQAGLFTEAQLRLASLYAEMGDKMAIKLCAILLKEPTAVRMRSDILFVKAAYYNKVKDIKNATGIYDQIIKEDYTYLDAYIEKGLLFYDMGNFAEAHKIFERSTNVSNTFADGYFWMAKAEEKMNKKQEAIDNYKRSLALDQSITEAKDALKRLGAVK
jgi:tetratricopeptide (TPR) repeat protein